MYPTLEIYPKRIENNARIVASLLHARGVTVAGVIKAANGIPEVVRAVADGGVDMIADSRIRRFAELRRVVPELPIMLLRAPSVDEVAATVRFADLSLNSEMETVRLLNQEAARLGVVHQVVLMAELGDTREGVYPPERIIDHAREIEPLTNVRLVGVGTNLTCLGSVVPDETNLGRLASLAEDVEAAIGRRLAIVSGGATSTIPLLIDDALPTRINQLRVGESILLGREVHDYWGREIAGLRHDTFILRAQVIEVVRKPSAPLGRLAVDAFGAKASFEDLGMRKRAILSVGKADFVYPHLLDPQLRGARVIGASSDHLVIDVEDAQEAVRVGDVVSLHTYYGAMLHLTASRDVTKLVVPEW